MTKRVALIGSAKRPDSAATIARLEPFFRKRAEIAYCDPTGSGGLPAGASLDLLISFGGDGSLLRLARELGGRPVPVMGVNFGTLGYMAEFSVEELTEHFDAALAGRLPVRRLRMLAVHLRGPAGTNFEARALNEVNVSAGPPFRMISLGLRIDGREVTTVSGDGLIISTPTGSTAYNLAAGGPIVLPDVAAVVITSICPHTLTHRPIVIPDGSRIEMVPMRLNEGTRLIADGQVHAPVEMQDVIHVGRADGDFQLIANPGGNAFHTLRTKLHWGVTPW
jgi:NAD+ kinase